MRRPNWASLSAPPRTCRIRLSTFAAFSGYWASSHSAKIGSTSWGRRSST